MSISPFHTNIGRGLPIALGGVALIGIGAAIGSMGTVFDLSRQSGSAAGFACIVLSLAMFSRGLRQGAGRKRNKDEQTQPA